MSLAFSLNDKIRNLEPYAPGAGDYPIRLDANESYFPLPEELKTEIAAAVAELPFNRYPDPLAADVCKAFADYYGMDAAYVTATNGSDEMLFLIATCFTQAGDTVVTVNPDFSMYRFYSCLGECRSVVYEKENLEIDPDALIECCKANDAKLLVFSNPCNPAGRGMTRCQVRRLIQDLSDCLIVLDEAYMDFWDESLLSEVTRYDNVMLLKTMSKAIGLAAIRLGFAVANATITAAIRACKSPYNVNSMTQAVGRVILSHPTLLRSRRAEIVAGRETLYAALQPVCVKNGWNMRPSVTNFVYIRTGDAPAVYEYLKTKGILVRNFGEALRVTVGTPAENDAVIAALQAYSG